eukprot:5785598-Alexandrium_andersonii.AAC.1
MELDDQTGRLCCAQDSRARPPQTDQSADKRSHVVNEGRRGGAAGREGGSHDRIKSNAPQKRFDLSLIHI